MRAWPLPAFSSPYRDSIPVFRCLVIAAFMAGREAQGTDRAPTRGASVREHGGTDGRILQRDHAENRDGKKNFFYASSLLVSYLTS